MKLLKTATAVVLAAALALSTAACAGADTSYAAKNDNLTVPIGGYIYYLYSAYGAAANKVEDKSKPVLDQQIDGKSAEQWIKDRALMNTNMLFVMNDKMRELNVTLSDTEKTDMKSTAQNMWSNDQALLTGFGIAQTSYAQALVEYFYNNEKLFAATYGKGGPKAETEESLTKYIVENCVSFEIALASLADPATGAPLEEAKRKEVTDKFAGYEKDINAGTTTLKEAAAAYAKEIEGQDTYTLVVDQEGKSSVYPAELLKQINALTVGVAKSMEYQGAQVLVKKLESKAASAEFLKTEGNFNMILSYMRKEEYIKEMEAAATAYTGAQMNEVAINKYNPKMFISTTSLAPASSAAASSEAASK